MAPLYKDHPCLSGNLMCVCFGNMVHEIGDIIQLPCVKTTHGKAQRLCCECRKNGLNAMFYKVLWNCEYRCIIRLKLYIEMYEKKKKKQWAYFLCPFCQVIQRLVTHLWMMWHCLSMLNSQIGIWHRWRFAMFRWVHCTRRGHQQRWRCLHHGYSKSPCDRMCSRRTLLCR